MYILEEKCEQYLKMLDELKLLIQQQANLNIPIEDAILVVETEHKIQTLISELQVFEQEILVH